MAQKRYFNWKDADRSDWVNRQHLAIMGPGVYRGFDAKHISSSGLNLILEHNNTGFSEVDMEGVLREKIGVWITTQAVVIQESDLVTFSVLANTSSAPRIDLIVGEHTYVASEGGVDAGYSVITGTPDPDPQPPTLSSPTTQIIIGYLYWPPSTSNVASNDVIYTRATVPIYAENLDYVMRHGYQDVVGTKMMQHIVNLNAEMTLDTSANRLNSAVLSNTYIVPYVNDDYEPVTDLDISHPPGANIHRIAIRTLQNLLLDGAAFKIVSDPSGIAGASHIAAGEVLELWDMRNTTGDIYVIRGDEAHKNRVSKFLKQVIFNKATAVFGSNAGEVSLASRAGNYYELSNDFDVTPGPILVNQIMGTNAYSVDNTSRGGNIIFLRLRASTSTTGAWQVNTSTLPTPGTGYKTIQHSTPLNMVLASGAVLTLLEDETTYRLLAVNDAKYNIVKMVEDYIKFEQYHEHHWQKMQANNWVTLTDAYDPTTNRLILPNTANSFDIAIPAGYQTDDDFFKDIVIDRGDGLGPVAAPTGVVVNIRIRISPAIGGSPNRFYFTTVADNIRSRLDNQYRTPASNTKYVVYANATLGETFTFLKTATTWELIAASTMVVQDITRRVAALESPTVVQIPFGNFDTPSRNNFINGSGDPTNLRGIKTGVRCKIEGKITRSNNASSDYIITGSLPPAFVPSFGGTLAAPQIVGTLMRVSNVLTTPEIYGVIVNAAGQLEILGGITAIADMPNNARYILNVDYSLVPPIV